MRKELDLTLAELALGRDRDVREVFDFRRTWMNRTLASFLVVEGPRGEEFETVTLPEGGPRAGILTMAGVLAQQAFNTRTSPTKRGVFVRERMLCQTVPPPPEAADQGALDTKTAVQARTVRERLQEHQRNPVCGACHAFFDPLGLAFERFDGVGLYRSTENGAPIDTRAELDGRPRELGALLKQDGRAAACLVREILRAVLGLEKLEDGAGPAVEGLADGLAQRGFRFADLVASLVTSPAFLTVTPAP
jgi:hypothetical protein